MSSHVSSPPGGPRIATAPSPRRRVGRHPGPATAHDDDVSATDGAMGRLKLGGLQVALSTVVRLVPTLPHLMRWLPAAEPPPAEQGGEHARTFFTARLTPRPSLTKASADTGDSHSARLFTVAHCHWPRPRGKSRCFFYGCDTSAYMCTQPFR